MYPLLFLFQQLKISNYFDLLMFKKYFLINQCQPPLKESHIVHSRSLPPCGNLHMSIIMINVTFLSKHLKDKWKISAALVIVLWLNQKFLSPKQTLGLQWGKMIFFSCSRARTNRYSLWHRHIHTWPRPNIPFAACLSKRGVLIAGTVAELTPLIVQSKKRKKNFK